MRLLLFKGKFGYLKEEINEGLIIFCHIEKGDTFKIIKSVSRRIDKFSKNQVILVPFAHLYEKAASKKEANLIFNLLAKELKENSRKKIKVIPFGIKKEFYLYAPATNSAIKFMKF